MPRIPKTFEGDSRRYVTDNLMCTWCGNTNQFNIDLHLHHLIQVKNGQVELSLYKQTTENTLGVIKKKMDELVEKCYDGEGDTFYCANCDQTESVDYQERVLDCCWNMGCCGCFHCQNWIQKDDLIEICKTCISENKGNVDEDHCDTNCMYSDYGLREIHDHYGFTLKDLKSELGY